MKSLTTLVGLGLLLFVAAVWGWSAFTQPLPDRDAGNSVCVERSVAAGEKVRRGDVTVSVLNAGTRNGLAGLTLELFGDAGFGEGLEGNAPPDTKVRVVQIWTENRRHPAVRLVKSQLGEAAKVVRREPTVPGVQVVVGDGFQELVEGRRAVKAREDVTVCGPPDSLG